SRSSVSRCLGLFDVLHLRSFLGRRRLVFFRYIGAVFRFENVTLDMFRRRTQILKQIFRVLMIGNKSVALDVSEALIDEPCHRVPRAAFAFTGKSLYTARIADILVAKSDKFLLWPDLDSEKLTFSGRAGFLSAPPLRLRPGMFGM